MAATLDTGQEEVVHFSFPIDKSRTEETAEINPVDGTPDLLIWGKATDGTIDGDHEIVDPEWSAKALQEWAAKGNVRMSHDPKRPVGSGREVHVTTDGHWVKSRICDPLAKHFIRQGVLNDYSVGISNPDFRYGDRKLDPQGKALRVITGRPDGSSRIAELSVVDRGSNFNSAFQIVRKSAGDGEGFVGKMVGSEDEITKAAPADLVKAARADDDAPVNVDVPKSATITFSPGDLNKLLEHRRLAAEHLAAELPAFRKAANAEAKILGKKSRNFSAERRRELAHSDNALPDGSYPIPDKDALRRAAILARSGHGNVEAARKLIARRARELGVNNPLDDNEPADGAEKSVDTAPEDMAVKDAEPDDDQPDSMPETSPPEAVKADGGDPHEPVLHHDDGEDDDTDSDADANEKAAQAGYQAAREHLTVKYGWTPEQLDALPGEAIAAIIAAEKAAEPDAEKADMPAKPPKMPCPKCKAMCKAKAKFCGKCGCSMMAEKASKPTPGDGVTGAAAAAIEPVPGHREPDGPAFEALEHDAGLPTVPDASLKTAVRMQELGVPNQEGMLHDLLCPAYPGASVKAAWPGADLSLTDEMGWQAKAFEAATTAPLGEFQQAAEKASQAWTAARILKSVPADLYEEIATEAHKAFRDANPGPGSAPQPGEMSAQRYNRPYVTAGHSAPSPDHDGPNRSPIHPEHISASDFSRGLITDGHAADSPENDSPRPMPVPAPEVPGVPSRVFYTNTQRQNAAQAMRQMHDHIAQTFPDLCPMHGPGRMGEPPSHARPVAAGVGGPVPHGASKAATGGLVAHLDPDSNAAPAMLDNSYVIPAGDAARLARKAEKRKVRELMEAVFKGDKTLNAARAELGLAPMDPPEAPGTLAKSAAAEVAPVVQELQVAQIGPDFEAIVTKATAPLLERLEKQEHMLDAIASQPDPAVTAYRGAAIAKASAAPAGPLNVPQRAEHAQDTAYRAMYDQWRNTSDPDQRERAYTYLMGASGLIPRPPS